MPEIAEVPRLPSERPIIERSPDGGVVHIRKPEATYTLDYGDHKTPRNPDDIPANATRLVVEGSAFTSSWAHSIYFRPKDMTDEEASERVKVGLPIEEGEEGKITYNSTSEIVYRYKDHTEYAPLFPILERRKTPFVVADMEFRDSVEHVIAAIEVIDGAIVAVGQRVAEMLPDNQKNIYKITATLRDAVAGMENTLATELGDKKVFDAMVYPSIVALAEGAIGAALLRDIIQAKGEKIGRRDFFRKMAKGAKAVTAAWLTMPAIEAALFASKGIQGDFIPPELRKLVEKTHPETWLFILTMRNVVLAYKEQWLAEHLASEQPQGEKPHITTTIGSAHTGLEDQLLSSPDERMRFLRAVQPLLLKMFESSTIYSMAEFGYNEDESSWAPSNFYEVPELRQLVFPETKVEEIDPQKDRKGPIDNTELQQFKEGEKHATQMSTDANPDKTPPFSTVHFRVEKKGADGRMLASIVVIPRVPYDYDNDDPEDWKFGKLRGDSTAYGYRAHVLSKDLERNLDIAPFGIDPLARMGWIGELMPEITKKNQQFDEEELDEEEFEDGQKEVKGYYSYGDKAIQILFYINKRGLEEITNNGCSILIEETEYSARNPIATSRHIITATSKTK